MSDVMWSLSFKGKIMNDLGYGDVEFEGHMGDAGEYIP